MKNNKKNMKSKLLCQEYICAWLFFHSLKEKKWGLLLSVGNDTFDIGAENAKIRKKKINVRLRHCVVPLYCLSFVLNDGRSVCICYVKSQNEKSFVLVI